MYSLHIRIVRHGQTHANVERLIQGHQDFPLTEIGVNNSVRTGQSLLGITFDQVTLRHVHKMKILGVQQYLHRSVLSNYEFQFNSIQYFMILAVVKLEAFLTLHSRGVI